MAPEELCSHFLWGGGDLSEGEAVSRVAQMAKMCRIFRDQHFSHVFYLVILENGQKVQKSCCFRVPNCGWRNDWFYLMIPGQKWLFLHQLRFDPPNCFGNTNKPLETTFHMPMPHLGPKEHQIWAFGGIFSAKIKKWILRFLRSSQWVKLTYFGAVIWFQGPHLAFFVTPAIFFMCGMVSTL